ncbi:MAG: hypothetical protein U0X39_11670 [Bacteroidales bacterium]
MKRYIYVIMILVLVIPGCELVDLGEFRSDTGYPTRFRKMSSSTLEAEKASFLQANPYLWTSINNYGFLGNSGDLSQQQIPPVDNQVSETEARQAAMNFLARNAEYAGVDNIDNIRIESAEPMGGFWDGGAGWHLHTSPQIIDTLVVLNTSILINVHSGEVYYSIGNWYPDVYIPGHIIVSRSKAVNNLLGKIVTHYSIAGQPYHVTITKEPLSQSKVNMVIYPLEVDDTIELRLVWMINIPGPVYYIIYVDAITGETIAMSPTIIS